MKKLLLAALSLGLCIAFSACSQNSFEPKSTAAATESEIKSVSEKAGPFDFDGENYYHSVYDNYKKQLKIYVGKDKSTEKYKFDFSDTSFFCGSATYNNKIYYVMSDTEKKITDIYSVENDKLLKEFSIKGVGLQAMQCKIADGKLYYSTENAVNVIDLTGKNGKQICTSNSTTNSGYVQFGLYDGVIYFTDKDGIYSISKSGKNKAKVVDQNGVNYFVIDSGNLSYFSGNTIYTYNLTSKKTTKITINQADYFNLSFGIHGDKIYYSVNNSDDSNSVSFKLHCSSFDGKEDDVIYTSPSSSWYGGVYFDNDKLYCSYFKGAAETDEVLVSMNLDGSKPIEVG